MTLLRCLLFTVFLAPGAERQRVEFTKDPLTTVSKNVAEEKAVLVDVRSKEEWEAGHIEGAIFLPVDSLRKHSFNEKKIGKTLPDKKEKKILYAYCVVGMRAKAAAAILQQLGYEVRALKPGYDELLKAGFEKDDVQNGEDEDSR